ncbi:hypothetical protein BS78_10G127100 [Paspalum vaginatum]|nr:hypothetical protein BS78_10G127100 [Paspalum vaginatum]KAJ1259094.1 hypothetical protein BS78_10G127100 [Paspalum vaginatum]KAJ1259095.1 hypothetical protein BS78_10G127100 [Paspalum vaginatum]KAJ1259096.1 hypothetical protein BS78_10G127100 [Paspalum vaginatum]KAJ1259097.1 hypothetical protein BS78_10G127100 [Paspalum vaginatum]
MRAMMPERRKSRSRLVGVRVGRSPAAASPSPPSRRRRKSGSVARGVRTAVRPAPLSSSRSRTRREGKGRALTRSASEPALWFATRVAAVLDGLGHDSPLSPPPPPLERPHTCFDVFDPDSPFGRSPSAASLTNPSPREEAKVVVSVTVEGSVGPVKAMVRLGASVGEAIEAVVDRYAREGRSPPLNLAAAKCFQLHRSHFSLQSLNKNDKIGDVGSRNFYLHKNNGSNVYLQNEDCDANRSNEIIQSCVGQPSGAPYDYQILTIMIKKLDKIGRRTKRIWRFITCNDCS